MRRANELARDRAQPCRRTDCRDGRGGGTSPRSARLAWPAAVAGITAFSFSATLYKLSGAPPAVGSALRFAYATLFLALLAWRAGALRPGPGFAPAASAGVLVGFEVVIWNEATGRIGAGPSTVIVNTASLWVMVLTVVVLRRRVGWRPVAGAVVVLCGLVLLRGTGAHRLELAGIALAILAAAIYGAYILVFERAVQRDPVMASRPCCGAPPSPCRSLRRAPSPSASRGI